MSKQLLSGRMAFPYIFEPRRNDDTGVEKFELTLLIKPEHACVKTYAAECLKLATEKFGGERKARAVLQARPIFKRGDERDNPPDGYAGNYYLTLRSKTMPDFYSSDRKRLTLAQAKELFYAGCMVNVLSSPWAYDAKGNRGVSHELLSIQFAGHGDAFSGRPSTSADDFPDLSAGGNDSFGESMDDIL